MDFLSELRWRGMLQDVTPGLEDYLKTEKVTAYIGFDPTAPSLTIGNYVQIMLLTLLQKYGHKPIVLLGGATGRIGDPSGKDKERQLKSYEELDSNLDFQKEQFKKLIDFSNAENPAMFINNIDFYFFISPNSMLDNSLNQLISKMLLATNLYAKPNTSIYLLVKDKKLIQQLAFLKSNKNYPQFQIKQY
jgi:tyrosyl-tRNA synthetase